MLVEMVTLDTPAGRLVGDFAPGEGDWALVAVHGFGGHHGGEKNRALAEMARANGWPFAAFDFRGHGASSGEMRDLRASGLLADLDAVADFLASRGVARVGLVGSSMGGFAASWFALRRPHLVTGLVLLAPAFRFLEGRTARLSPDELAEWERTGVRRFASEWLEADLSWDMVAETPDFLAADLFARWSHPALVIHGVADTVIPFEQSVRMLREVPFPNVELRLIKDGDHRLTAHKDAIARAAADFFGTRRGNGIQSTS